MADSRQHDIIAWGATGYTGQLVAEELLARYGPPGDGSAGVRWAIGGRSAAKLEASPKHSL